MPGPDDPPSPAAPVGRGGSLSRLPALTRKELREALRDRRTLVTLVLMPLLVYPLLSVGFQQLFFAQQQPHQVVEYRLGFRTEKELHLVGKYIAWGQHLLEEKRQRDTAAEAKPVGTAVAQAPRSPLPLPLPGMQPAPNTPPKLQYFLPNEGVGETAKLTPDQRLETAVRDLSVEVAVRLAAGGDLETFDPEDPELGERDLAAQCEVLYVSEAPTGEQARIYVQQCLRAANEKFLSLRLANLKSQQPAQPLAATYKSLDASAGAPRLSLKTLVPLILILMTITGAVYPAIDLTAGERERGTLELIAAAPVSRFALLLAKYFTVLTVATLTATMNLAAMTVTLYASGIAPLLLGEEGLGGFAILQVFGLTLLFAAFFSAVLLSVTSFARSFKEAQAFLIPIMLLSIGPGVAAMLPGVTLTGPMLVAPLLNIVLLGRELLTTGADPTAVAVVVGSTGLYAFAALTIASKLFLADVTLYDERGSWTQLFQRPHEDQPAGTISAASLCLAFVFSAMYVVQGFIAQLGALGIETRLLASSTLSALLFVGFPLVAARLGRVELYSGFRLAAPRLGAIVGAVLLGLSLWTFSFELVAFFNDLGIKTYDETKFKVVEQLLAQWREIPLPFVIFAMGAAPAFCEELFFRGYLLAAFLSTVSRRAAILASGLLFGLFHLILFDRLAVERFASSALLGLLLAAIAVRTGSVWPGAILHFVHNSLIVSIGYFQPQLEASGWGVAEEKHLPLNLLAVAAVLSLAGGALLYYTGAPRKPVPPPPPASDAESEALAA